MIVDELILHHTYNGGSAFDVSKRHHHGALEGTPVPDGSALVFGGGSDLVRVHATDTLASMRAVRTTVRFFWRPESTPRRYNLIEGYLSFALFITAEREIQGTVNTPAGWVGARSAQQLIQPLTWHTVTFVFDGVSAARIDLDGVTVAESLDVIAPMGGVAAPFGIAIGHWPNPDPRYSFTGKIDDVKVWKDRPDAVRDLADSCCCHEEEKVDEAFARLRAGGFDGDTYRAAAQQVYDLGSKVFGQMAAGSQADRQHAHLMAHQFATAITQRDRTAMADSIGNAYQLLQGRLSAGELAGDAAALQAALAPTVLGPVLQTLTSGGSVSSLDGVFEKYGIDGWLDGFCMNWAKPPRPKRPDRKPTRHPDRSEDPTTDHDPKERPPSWGAGSNRYDDASGSPK